jgi:hypothetical protein
MNKQEFEKMIEETTFDENVKRLFHISYDLGFNEGRILQMQKAINTLDSFQFEKEMQ